MSPEKEEPNCLTDDTMSFSPDGWKCKKNYARAFCRSHRVFRALRSRDYVAWRRNVV